MKTAVHAPQDAATTPEEGRTDRCATLQDPLTPPPAQRLRGRGSVTFDPKYRRNLPLKINLCAPLTLFRGNSSFRTAAAGSSTVEWPVGREQFGGKLHRHAARGDCRCIRFQAHKCSDPSLRLEGTADPALLRTAHQLLCSMKRPAKVSPPSMLHIRAHSCNKSVSRSRECRDRRCTVLGKQMREDQLPILIPNW